MLSLPVVLRNGIITNLQQGDIVNTREPDDLSTNAANPTTITAAQLVAADLYFADPGTPENIVTLPTAEDIIQQILLVSETDLCHDLSNTTVWASYQQEDAPEDEDGSANRTLAHSTFRRTFYRNTLGFSEDIFLELNKGLTWDFTLENIGEDLEVPAGDAVLFNEQEWKTLLFRILNSSPAVSPVGATTIGSAVITVDDAETFLENVTIGMRLYTADDTVFVSSNGELTVTAVDKVLGTVTVSAVALLASDPFSFELTPHIEIIPVMWGRTIDPEVLAAEVEPFLPRKQWLAVAFNQEAELVADQEFVFHLPQCTISAVYAGLKTPSDAGSVTLDITQDAVSILSTLISIDEDEDHSSDAATPPVISDSTITNWARMVLKVVSPGANAFGVTLYFDVTFTG